MKRIISLAIICLAFVQLIAQNLPQGIAYQAVAVKDGPYSIAGQNPQAIYWSNKDINVRFTIFEKYPGGSTQYSEFHATKTDDYGVFNLIIGQGNPISGDFTKIPWDLGTAHLQVEIDFDNNGIYKLTSLERFWSVPYAFVTRKSSSNSTDSALNALNSKFNYLKNRDKDTVIGNEGGVSYKSLDSLNKVLLAKLAALKASDKDTVIGNEWQKLTRNKDTLILSDGGGKVTLLDEDPKNELQFLTRTKDTVSLSQNGGKFVLNDDDPKNELQDLKISADSIGLSKSSIKIAIPKSSSSVSDSFSSGASVFLAEEIDYDLFCDDGKQVNPLGTPYYSIRWCVDMKDSIYFFGYYSTSVYKPYTAGDFIISKSKKNCGVKLIYKSINTDWFGDPNAFGSNVVFSGLYKNTVSFFKIDKNKDEHLMSISLPNLNFTTTKISLPYPVKQPFGSSNNFGDVMLSHYCKDTVYIIASHNYSNGGSSYYGQLRFFKFEIKSGKCHFIDSTSDYSNFSQGQQQFFDSVVYKSVYSPTPLFYSLNLRTLKKDTLWVNKKINLPDPNFYFNYFVSKKLLCTIIRYPTFGFEYLFVDIKSGTNFYEANSKYLKLNPLGYGNRYQPQFIRPQDWNKPFGYTKEPKIKYFK
jgi:hypothetical protein